MRQQGVAVDEAVCFVALRVCFNALRAHWSPGGYPPLPHSAQASTCFYLLQILVICKWEQAIVHTWQGLKTSLSSMPPRSGVQNFEKGRAALSFEGCKTLLAL